MISQLKFLFTILSKQQKRRFFFLLCFMVLMSFEIISILLLIDFVNFLSFENFMEYQDFKKFSILITLNYGYSNKRIFNYFFIIIKFNSCVNRNLLISSSSITAGEIETNLFNYCLKRKFMTHINLIDKL